jgi:sarcosine oxidase subunit beta
MGTKYPTDIAIIGAGITGLSVAYYLGLHGFSRVVVYEREGMGSGASGVAPGGIRRQWSTPVSCAMSEESFRFYQQVNEALEPEGALVFRECGYLFLAHSERVQHELEANIALQHQFDIPSRMVAPDELNDVLPALCTETILAASYCSEDGYFDDPWGVLTAFASAARRFGVKIERAQVTALEPDGVGWRLHLADGGCVPAERAVVAAGSDAVQLIRPLGIDLPISAEPRYLFYSNPVEERVCDPLVISAERQFAVKQLADGQFLTSYLGAGRDDAGETPEAWRGRIAEVAADLLPALLDLSLPHLVKGYYDMTPDHQPIVGPIPGNDGLFVAAGLSGHGFMMAPAVGRAISDLLRGIEPVWYFRGLGPDRFSVRGLATESQVI